MLFYFHSMPHIVFLSKKDALNYILVVETIPVSCFVAFPSRHPAVGVIAG